MRTYKEIAELSIEKAAVIKKKKKKRMMALGIAGGVISCLMIAVAVTISVLYYQYKQLYPYDLEIKGYKPEGEGLICAESVSELYNFFEYNISRVNYYKTPKFGPWLKDEILKILGPKTVCLSKGEGQHDSSYLNDGYSKTNVQVDGIDEADTVKCDGEYIYYLRDEIIYIVKADKDNVEIISSFEGPSFSANRTSINDIYIYENKLITVGIREYNIYLKSVGGERSSLCIGIYDISDKAAPSLTKTLCLSGNTIDSRLMGNKLYVATNDNLGIIANSLVHDDIEAMMPKFYVDDEERMFDAGEVYYMPESDYFGYINIAVIDLDKEEFEDKVSLLGCGGYTYYQSYENIYVATRAGNNTLVYRFSTESGLELAADTTMSGWLLNNFSLDEYNGYLRAVVKQEEGGASLYVMNMDLKKVGAIFNVAIGEDLKSVRFDGDVAYFVTYRQIDPLFCADLSDPVDPRILSELKIPGFSEYLHLYREGLLFGLGSTDDRHVKLSMFDVTDKMNVKEKAVRILEDIYLTWNYEDHHGIMVDGERELICFLGYESYYICTYDDDFKILKKIPLDELYRPDEVRGLYIDGYFYLCTPVEITSYEMENFESASNVILFDSK